MACISNSTKAIVITAEVLGFVVLIAALYVVYRIFVVRYVRDRDRDVDPDEEKGEKHETILTDILFLVMTTTNIKS